jgi:hypothetical protein
MNEPSGTELVSPSTRDFSPVRAREKERERGQVAFLQGKTLSPPVCILVSLPRVWKREKGQRVVVGACYALQR